MTIASMHVTLSSLNFQFLSEQAHQQDLLQFFFTFWQGASVNFTGILINVNKKAEMTEFWEYCKLYFVLSGQI